MFSPDVARSMIQDSEVCPHCREKDFAVIEHNEDRYKYQCNSCKGKWFLGYTVIQNFSIVICSDEECDCILYGGQIEPGVN
jgi:hypothetical protein